MKRVILLKSHARTAGGLEKSALQIEKAFRARGAEVTLLTEAQMSSPPSRWPAFRRMEQFDQFVSHWLQNHPHDLVFGMDRNRFQTHLRAGNGVHAAYLESRIASEGRLKWISCLCNPLHRKILSFEKSAFEHPALQHIFTNSNLIKNQILERYRVDPKKIIVIHNGVEWQSMSGSFAAQDFSSKKRFELLFIGNGYRRKGLHLLLQALALLNSSDLHLSVVGKDRHESQFRRFAQKLNIESQVTFFGMQTDMSPFYQRCDALAIPSFYDPFANVTVEALAMGLFVISSCQNGGHEILTPDNGVILHQLHVPEELVEALRKAIVRPKNRESALRIRNSVKYLDFPNQMQKLMDACFGEK